MGKSMSLATIGVFRTPNASKYLQQLCKHFAHKVDAEFDAESGVVAFPMGPARMAANAECLTVTFDLKDAADRERAHMVIDKHLERFAFREDFKHMTWDA
jgi:hypothetical protein